MSEAENKKMIRYLAILRVFDKHIANFCYAHSNSSADAQDLSQEILALVWENLDGLKADTDAPARVNRWLNKVMFTAFVRHLRQRPRITTVPLSDAVDVADSPEETVITAVGKLVPYSHFWGFDATLVYRICAGGFHGRQPDDAGEALCRDIARGYRRGSRRVDLRHYAVTLLVGLCLVVLTARITAWSFPYTMSGGDRQERLAAFTLTQKILMQS